MKPVVTTQKFHIREAGETKIYRPGNVIENVKSAKWAIENQYAEQREPSSPKKTTNSKPPRNVKKLGAPENKDAAQAPKNASSNTNHDEAEMEETEGESAKE